MGIHRAELRRIETTEGAAGVDMVVVEVQFADQPHDLLDFE
jgi:hypothetical protein